MVHYWKIPDDFIIVLLFKARDLMPEGCQRILSLYTVSSLWANIYPAPIKLFGRNGNPHLVDAGATWLCHNQIRLPERIGQFILDHKPLNLTAYVSSKKLRILKHERISADSLIFINIFTDLKCCKFKEPISQDFLSPHLSQDVDGILLFYFNPIEHFSSWEEWDVINN